MARLLVWALVAYAGIMCLAAVTIVVALALWVVK